jgi:predicted DNA-binding protein YlxM (UPF0122 family)
MVRGSVVATKGIRKKELLGLLDRFSTRIDLLSDEQKMFVRLFLDAQNFRSIATMAGVNEATIARRLKKIADRISSNNFITALSQNSSITGEKMEILKDYFVNALPMARIAKDRNLSRYRVRKIIKTVVSC